ENVQAVWSPSGSTQIPSNAKWVNANRKSESQWQLTLPTAGLLDGQNMLLVVVQDQAGNRSDATPFFIRLHAEEALELAEANRTTLVGGRVLNRGMPFGKAKLELHRQDDAESSVLKSESRPDGSFTFENVRSGKYVLEMRGIVRGMRIERKQNIEVNAPLPLDSILFRLDQSAKSNEEK
ncbi:MAG: Ig-like domain-containing protein, partial [Planctomycetota bacterium]